MYKILIADDELMIRNGIVDLLSPFSNHFNHIITAEDGLEALAKVKEFSPEIVLFDINMPFLTGLDAIKKIRSFNQNTLIIIISGYNKFEYAQQAIENRVFAYLLKPINQEEFAKTLMKALSAISKQPSFSSTEKEGNSFDGIVDYINNHFHENHLTINLLCDLFHTSPSSIARILKKETGLNFSNYLTKVRISQAISLLTGVKDMNIKEVSASVGYKNQHYFSRAFKNHTGLSPKQFLQSLNK